MQDQLKLAAKPQRQAKERQLEQAEQRAYDRAYSSTRKEIAKAEGAAAGVRDAAGGNDPAVEGARQRALGAATKPEVSPSVGTTGLRNPSSVPEFVDADVRGTRRRIPTRVYDLPADQQQRFFDSLEEADQQQKDDNLALQSVNQMLDLRDKDSARVNALESQVGSLLSIVEALQRRIDAKDATVELAKSDALVDAESQLAQTIVNAGAVKAQLEATTANSAREA
jgi:hypothetical protein